MHRPRSLDNRYGYNLIEAAIVLGVAGLIIGGVFAAWGAVNSQNRLRRAQDQITVIVNQVRSTYGNRNALDNTDGATFTKALLNAGLLPDSWVTNTSTQAIGNPYGGTIVVTPDSVPSSSVKDAMNITLSGMGKSDCYRLAGGMLGNGRTQGLYKLDSATVTNSTAFTNIKGSVCNNGSNSRNLSLYFGLKSGT